MTKKTFSEVMCTDRKERMENELKATAMLLEAEGFYPEDISMALVDVAVDRMRDIEGMSTTELFWTQMRTSANRMLAFLEDMREKYSRE